MLVKTLYPIHFASYHCTTIALALSAQFLTVYYVGKEWVSTEGRLQYARRHRRTIDVLVTAT